MDKCPRCENEKLKEEYKYCPICGAILEFEVAEASVEILKAMLIKYKAYRCEDAEEETLIPSVIGALVVAINALERAAQEVPVQEQLNQISTGSKTINQIRKAYGLKAIEGGDQYMSKIQLRTILLEALLGNEVTIFIEEKGSNLYKVEVIDSNKREKLLIINLNKLSKFRYCLLDYQSF